jgi:hypothetical protein
MWHFQTSRAIDPVKERTTTKDAHTRCCPQNLPNTDEDIRTGATRKHDKVQQNTGRYISGNRTRIRGNKRVCPPSCEPHGGATASRSPSSSTAATRPRLPGEPRYGENRGKKSGCLGRKQWEKCFGRGFRGGGGEGREGCRGARANVRTHAPFGLPPIA